MNRNVQIGATEATKSSGQGIDRPVIQKKCACGKGVSGECGECKDNEQKVQRYAADQSSPSDLLNSLAGSPRESPNSSQGSERRLSHDFGNIRVTAPAPPSIQTRLAVSQPGDPHEAEADRIAQQVTFGVQNSVTNQAHDLSPRTPGLIQRSPAEGSGAASGLPPVSTPESVTPAETPHEEQASRGALLVEDDVQELEPGQMRKSEFIDELQRVICTEADAELAKVGRNTEGCPYIERWMAYYRNRTAAQGERSLRRYAPESAGVTNARDYIPIVAARVRRAVSVWATTGRITDVPPELAAQIPGAGLLGAAAGILGGIGRAFTGLFAKARDGGVNQVDDPERIRTELGSGASLEGGVRSRMESAFGYDFSRVRIHNDGNAARLSNDLNARAFTVGSSVAFASGEYRPGSIVGDALLAHELAHVVQQGGGTGQTQSFSRDDSAYGALEQDADYEAARAVTSLWVGKESRLPGRAQSINANQKSGLRLQRCGPSAPQTRTPTQQGQQPTQDQNDKQPAQEQQGQQPAQAPHPCAPIPQLTWADFQGKPPKGKKAKAFTKYDQELAMVNGKQVVRAFFENNKSWVRKAYSDPTNRKETTCDKSIKNCETFFDSLKADETGTNALKPLSPDCPASITPNPSVLATSRSQCSSVLGPECDRVAGLESARLLRHEQLHLDIACVMAAKGTKAIADNPSADPNVILNAVKTKTNALSDKSGTYDADTGSGCNASAQATWEEDVAKGLPSETIP
jgi:hypothetical protein